VQAADFTDLKLHFVALTESKELNSPFLLPLREKVAERSEVG